MKRARLNMRDNGPLLPLLAHKPTKYVVTVTVKTSRKVTKKAIRQFLEEAIEYHSGDIAGDFFVLNDVRVRTVDFD